MIADPDLSGKPSTLALIPNDVVGDQMAGPGIRYWEFARFLGAYFPVKLIVPPLVPMAAMQPPPSFPAAVKVCTTLPQFQAEVAACDVIVTLGVILYFYPFLSQLGKPLVLDIYNPFLLEDLQREAAADWSKRLASHENFLEAIRIQLQAGDFFLCASEKQRAYWLGMLSTAGRVNPYTYQHDSTLRRLIEVVPFGLPAEPPRQTRSVLKGVHKSISAEDKLLVWNGGLWNWFDVPTLIRAMPLVLRQRTDVKLFFMGVFPPTQHRAGLRPFAERMIALSRDLDLYDRFIFFNDWVPYEERQNYLLEADLAVSLHLETVETDFAFRTRLLDCIWTGLPVVTTRGDVLGELLAAHGLARLVAPGDVAGVAQAILALLDIPAQRADCAPGFQELAARFQWEVVARPLLEFCRQPYLAPDKPYLAQRAPFMPGQNTTSSLWGKAWRAVQLDGLPGLVRRGREYLRWKLSQLHRW